MDQIDHQVRQFSYFLASLDMKKRIKEVGSSLLIARLRITGRRLQLEMPMKFEE